MRQELPEQTLQPLHECRLRLETVSKIEKVLHTVLCARITTYKVSALIPNRESFKCLEENLEERELQRAIEERVRGAAPADRVEVGAGR